MQERDKYKGQLHEALTDAASARLAANTLQRQLHQEQSHSAELHASIRLLQQSRVEQLQADKRAAAKQAEWTAKLQQGPHSKGETSSDNQACFFYNLRKPCQAGKRPAANHAKWIAKLQQGPHSKGNTGSWCMNNQAKLLWCLAHCQHINTPWTAIGTCTFSG